MKSPSSCRRLPRLSPGAAVVLQRDIKTPGAPRPGTPGLVLLVDDHHNEVSVEFHDPKLPRARKVWRLRPEDLVEPPKQRRRPDADHCVHGHLLDADNLYVSPTQPRGVCKACRRQNGRRYLSQLKGKPVAVRVLP